MIIDEPTLMTVLGLAALAAAALFFSLASFTRSIPGVRCWAGACLAVGIATVIDGPRLVTNWQLASLLFNIPVSVGQVLILAGTMQFCARPGAMRALWTLSLAAAAITIGFTYIYPDSSWRIGSLSLHQMLVNGWTAFILWNFPDRGARRAFRVASLVAVFQGAAALAQGILVVSSQVAVTYAAPQLPLANIISWAGAMVNILVGNWMLLLLIMLRLVSELRTAAERDVLTGLLNRRGLRHRIDAILQRASAATLGMVIIDIDYFKQVNDRHGHEVGDRVLVVMGTVLLGLKVPNATVCRWGGEEFCILVEGATCAQLRALAERVRQRFERDSAALPGLDGGVTASAGIAVRPLEARFDMAVLIREADAQLYRAKAAGRDRTEMADSVADSVADSTA